MVVGCEQVWREISNYLDGEVEPQLRSAMETHFRECKRCTAVLEGTRNVIHLYGDTRMVEVPLGYAQRLHRRLEENMPGPKGWLWGWATALALAALLLISFEVGHSPTLTPPGLRSQHAQPGVHVPPDLMVVVSTRGKTFHAAGCRFIHDTVNLRTVAAAEAIREGYAPCVRCMRKYLTASAIAQLAVTQKEAESAEFEGTGTEVNEGDDHDRN